MAQEIPGIKDTYPGGNEQYSSIYNQRYLHDMRQEQEVLQDKIEFADKVLREELRIFKKKLVTDF